MLRRHRCDEVLRSSSSELVHRGPILALLLASCGAKPDTAPTQAPEVASTPKSTTWAVVRAEIEETICIHSVEIPERGKFDVSSYGDRGVCGLQPPADPIERAVATAFKQADGVLVSLREERRAAAGALARGGRDASIDAVRRAYLSDAFLGVLLPPLYRALEAEGLPCEDCPEPKQPERREVQWDVFAPYVLAHVWPDPVVTPVDASGTPTGRPKISVHICGGINGVEALSDPDPALVRAGYLAAFHSEVVREWVGAFFDGLEREEGFTRLKTDEERTAWLREAVAQRLLADARVRIDVCAKVQQFTAATGVVVTDCA